MNYALPKYSYAGHGFEGMVSSDQSRHGAWKIQRDVYLECILLEFLFRLRKHRSAFPARILLPTSLFIYTQHRNPNTSTPSGYLSYFVHELIQTCQASIFPFQLKDHAEMFRQPAKSPNILLDEFRCSMMIIKKGKEAVNKNMIYLPYTNV